MRTSWAAISLAALFPIAFYGPARPPFERPQPDTSLPSISEDDAASAWEKHVREREILQAVEARFDEAVTRAKQRDAEALTLFLTETDDLLRDGLSNSLASARLVTKRLSTVGQCSKLAGLMALDQIGNGSRAEDYLSEELEPISDSLFEANVASEQARQRFQVRLASSRNRFQSEVGEILGELPGDAVPEEWIKHYRKVMGEGQHAARSGAQNVAVSAALAATLVPLDVFLTRRALENVGKSALSSSRNILGKAAARSAGAATASGTAAVVDGPVPIGDIIGAGIAVVGVAWAGWDVYKAKQRMATEFGSTLETSLQTSFAEMKATSHEWAESSISTSGVNYRQLTRNTLSGFRVHEPIEKPKS